MRRYVIAAIVLLAAGTWAFWWLTGGFGPDGNDFFGWASALRVLAIESLLGYAGTAAVLMFARPARLDAVLSIALLMTAIGLGAYTLYSSTQYDDAGFGNISPLYPLATVQLAALLLWACGIRRNAWFGH